MNTDRPNNTTRFSDEKILQFVREHEDPCITAGEIAEAFDVTNEAANYRLKKLRDKGKLKLDFARL